MHICEFEFLEDEGGYLCWPFWPGCDACTGGYGYSDAVETSARWLKERVLDAIAHYGRAPHPPLGHEPLRGGTIVAIAVDASLAEVPAVTEKEAAERLGVSYARVSQLCHTGSLDSWTVGRTRLVSEASIELRLAQHPGAGRPRRKREALSA